MMDSKVFSVEIQGYEMFRVSSDTRQALVYASELDAPVSEALLALAAVAKELEAHAAQVEMT